MLMSTSAACMSNIFRKGFFYGPVCGKEEKKKEVGDLYQRIDKKLLRYVTERDLDTYVESVIGKSGMLNVYGDEIAVYCDGKEVFRSRLADSEVGELMSLEGPSSKGLISRQESFAVSWLTINITAKSSCL